MGFFSSNEFSPGLLLITVRFCVLVVELAELSLSEDLSMTGACSRPELFLAVTPLGTSREGVNSPP